MNAVAYDIIPIRTTRVKVRAAFASKEVTTCSESENESDHMIDLSRRARRPQQKETFHVIIYSSELHLRAGQRLAAQKVGALACSQDDLTPFASVCEHLP